MIIELGTYRGRVRLGGWTIAVVLVAVAGCTSTGVSRSPATSAPASTSSTTPVTAVSSAPAPPRTAAQLCPAATTDAAVAACLVTSLNAFWSTQLHRSVAGHVMLGFPATFPPACRFPKQYLAIHARTAFECPANDTLYYGPVFLRHLHENKPADDFPERLAATMGHEEGHLVQDTVHQRQPDTMSPDAGSRFIEQQADCLSGVWAHGIGLDADAFLTAAHAMLTDVDDAEHRRDHGTVDQRLTAVRRGLSGVAACHLPRP